MTKVTNKTDTRLTTFVEKATLKKPWRKSNNKPSGKWSTHQYPADHIVMPVSAITAREAVPAGRSKSNFSKEEFEEYVRIFFMNGQCHAMALAIHETLGWTLMGCGWKYYNLHKPEGEKIPNHIFVCTPKGQSVDICGKFNAGQHPDKSVKTDWKEMSLAEVQYLFSDEHKGRLYHQPDMKTARREARKLLHAVR